MSKVVDHSLPKPCKKCGLVLPPEAFNLALATKSLPGARKSECKKCQYAAHKQWAAENPEKVSALKGRYAESDRKRNREYSRKQVDELTDRYVTSTLRMDQKPPQPLIDIKREQLSLQRLTKELKQALEELEN